MERWGSNRLFRCSCDACVALAQTTSTARGDAGVAATTFWELRQRASLSVFIHPLIPIHRAVQRRHVLGAHDLRAIFLVARLQAHHGFPGFAGFEEDALEGRLTVGK